jgi:Metallo-beta-lactamase superfamily
LPCSVYALRNASRPGLRSSQHFFGCVDPDGDRAMPMDYCMWVAASDSSAAVIDTGFTESVARPRGHMYLGDPIDMLAELGVDPRNVSHVILSHFTSTTSATSRGFRQPSTLYRTRRFCSPSAAAGGEDSEDRLMA